MGEIVAEGWITINQAGSLTGYSTAYLRRLARRGRIKAQKVGELWLIHRDDLLTYKARMDRLGNQKHDPTRLDDLEGGRHNQTGGDSDAT